MVTVASTREEYDHVLQTHVLFTAERLPSVIGLDAEWKPIRSGRRKDGSAMTTESPPSVIQLASFFDDSSGTGSTTMRVVLFTNLYRLGLPRKVKALLEDPSVAKVTVGGREDVKRLYRAFDAKSVGVVDLNPIFATFQTETTTQRRSSIAALPKNTLQYGLKNMCHDVLGFDISKDESIACSDWSQLLLSYRQLQCALPFVLSPSYVTLLTVVFKSLSDGVLRHAPASFLSDMPPRMQRLRWN